jgi:hypothetical protein
MEQNPDVLALYFDVSFMISGLWNDHNLTVFAVVCGDDLSGNPIMESSSDTVPKFFLECLLRSLAFYCHADRVLHVSCPFSSI